jgi:hypothetical protein
MDVSKRRHKLNMDLLTTARKIRDAFTYDPGHSDLDREQPIHITIPLGTYRDLTYLVTAIDMEIEQSGQDRG